jgi:hypothetical protein
MVSSNVNTSTDRCTCPMSLRQARQHSIACDERLVPNGTAPSATKRCASCGKDLGPGPFAEGEPYACSLRCFYALHPTRVGGELHA